MKKVSAKIEKVKALLGWLSAMKIPIHAAHTGFFMVLSIFPTLMLILGFCAIPACSCRC